MIVAPARMSVLGTSHAAVPKFITSHPPTAGDWRLSAPCGWNAVAPTPPLDPPCDVSASHLVISSTSIAHRVCPSHHRSTSMNYRHCTSSSEPHHMACVCILTSPALSFHRGTPGPVPAGSLCPVCSLCASDCPHSFPLVQARIIYIP
ncbi:hypothetical protein M758_3G045300 [Ceratodon purpureus]|nr:hypothetical protein M758_3G045300 [Ceratodon purpureus]